MSDEKDKRSTNGNGSTNGEQKKKRGRPPKAQTKEAEPAKAPNQAKEKKLERFSIRSIIKLGFLNIDAPSVVEDFLFKKNKDAFKEEDGKFVYKSLAALKPSNSSLAKYRAALLNRTYRKGTPQTTLDANKLDGIAALLILTFTAGGFEEIIEEGYSGKINYASKIEDRIKEYILTAKCTEEFFLKRKDKGIDSILYYQGNQDEIKDSREVRKKKALRMLVSLLILAFDVDVPEDTDIAKETYEGLDELKGNEEHCKKGFPIPSITDWDRSRIICNIARAVLVGDGFWDDEARELIDGQIREYSEIKFFDDNEAKRVEDVYVPAKLLKSKTDKTTADELFASFLDNKEESVLCIKGHPGYGKSTLLKQWFSCMAKALGKEYSLDVPFPLFIIAKDIKALLGKLKKYHNDAKEVFEVLTKDNEVYKDAPYLKQTIHVIEHILSNKKRFGQSTLVVIMLDGLDEIKSDLIRECFFWLDKLMQVTLCKIIITSRNISLKTEECNPVYAQCIRNTYIIQELDEEQLKEYIDKLAGASNIQLADSFYDSLLNKEQEGGTYKRLSRVPLFTKYLLDNYERKGNIPRNHIEAIDLVIASTMERQAENANLPDLTKSGLLEKLAEFVFNRACDMDDYYEKLNKYDISTERIIELIKEQHLMEAHESFNDYFIAYHVFKGDMNSRRDRFLAFFDKKNNEEQLSNVIILCIYLVYLNKQRQSKTKALVEVESFVEQLLAIQEKKGACFWNPICESVRYIIDDSSKTPLAKKLCVRLLQESAKDIKKYNPYDGLFYYVIANEFADTVSQLYKNTEQDFNEEEHQLFKRLMYDLYPVLNLGEIDKKDFGIVNSEQENTLCELSAPDRNKSFYPQIGHVILRKRIEYIKAASEDRRDWGSVTIEATVKKIVVNDNCARSIAKVVSNSDSFKKEKGGFLINVNDDESVLVLVLEKAKGYDVPENTAVVGPYAFAGKKSVMKVSLPDSVKQICEAAFKSCVSLEEIVCKATKPPKLHKTAFANDENLHAICVPQEQLEAYKSAEIWCDYKDVLIGI